MFSCFFYIPSKKYFALPAFAGFVVCLRAPLKKIDEVSQHR